MFESHSIVHITRFWSTDMEFYSLELLLISLSLTLLHSLYRSVLLFLLNERTSTSTHIRSLSLSLSRYRLSSVTCVLLSSTAVLWILENMFYMFSNSSVLLIWRVRKKNITKKKIQSTLLHRKLIFSMCMSLSLWLVVCFLNCCTIMRWCVRAAMCVRVSECVCPT